MGHGSYGGVKACYCNAFEGQPTAKGAFIRNWVSQLNPVREKIKRQNHDTEDKALKAMELETVRLSLNNLMSFPFVKARVESGHLKLHGAYFAIEDGVLHMIDDMGAFKPVEYFDK